MLKLKKEDNYYSSNLGVDDIEDIIDSGLDWSDADYSNLKDDPRDYDDPSRLVTIAQAEKIIGERPDASKPKPPTSKNPRPDTIKKYQDAVKSYKDRLKALSVWEKKYDRLVAQAQSLKNIQDQLSDIEESLVDWCTRNPGTYIIRDTLSSYSLIQDPVEALDTLIKDLDIPDEIESMDNHPKWMVDNIEFDEDSDIFSSVLITLDNDVLRIISIPDDLNDVSMAIEDYVASIQPKNLLSDTNAKLDQKSEMTLKVWDREGTTNSQLDENEQDLKLYLASVCFVKEIQQLSKYPNSTSVGSMVKNILKEI